MSSSLESQEWSENIVILGMGVFSWSTRYRVLTRCLAGIGEVSGWLRLYPILKDDPGEVFDIVRVLIRDENPETHRPESRKIWPGRIQVIGSIQDKAEKSSILQEHTELGVLLHGERWRTQTLGIIQPLEPVFYVYKNRVVVVYHCDDPSCRGHRQQVTEFTHVDVVGRWRMEDAEEVLRKCKQLVKGDLRFVVGTHSYHPAKWLLVAIHSISISTHREKERSATQAKRGAMQVLVVVTDDDGRSETLQLDRIKTTKNYVKFGAGDMGKPVISTTYVAKDFKATGKAKKS